VSDGLAIPPFSHGHANYDDVIYSEKLFETTMAAAVTCTFNCLSPLSGPTLERALLILEKIQTVNSQTVQSVLYDRAKIFFEQFPHIDSAKTQQSVGEERSGDVSKEVEAFSSRLIDVLFGPKTSEAEPEATRLKRAALAVTYVNCVAASEKGGLASTLGKWLASERSRTVRETLKRALLVISVTAHDEHPAEG
jgi:hypothetical protein